LPHVFATTEPAHYIADNTYVDNFMTSIKDASGNTLPINNKTIQELFELNYGRMNALLGTELQFTNFNTQTTHQMNFPDLPTEIIPDGQTQVWMIIHNGVDTHFVHFHLVNVQVVNRVDWAGVVKPPYDDETGWRETVRADPLEQVIVAVRPAPPVLPAAWPTPPGSNRQLPDSIRPLDVTKPVTGEVGKTFNRTTNSNPLFNFGYEYVWHCHLLGHEENDMMRPMTLEVPETIPADPDLLWLVPNPDPGNTWNVVLGTSNGCAAPLTCPADSQLKVQWTNHSTDWPNDAIGFYVQRCAGAGCGFLPFPALPALPADLVATVTPYKPLPDFYNPALLASVDPALNQLLPAFLYPSYMDTAIDRGVIYNYQVTAFNSLGNSASAVITGPRLSGAWGAATGVTITPNSPTPHNAGTAVLFTAAATSASPTFTNYEYQFSLDTNGGGYVVVQPWSLVATWSMPGSTLPGNYSVKVQARAFPTDAGVSNTLAYVVRNAPATSVVISADQPSPHIAGSAVLFSATGQGSSNYQYKFWLDGGVVQAYSPVATWSMPALTPVGVHPVRVDVRTNDAVVTYDATSTVNYEIGLGITFVAGANGSLTGTLVQGVVPGGSTSAVTAVPAVGYHLVNWTGGSGFVSTANPLIVTNVLAGDAIMANFAINAYAVSFVAGANGTLSGTASQNVNYGSSASAVTAVPANFYHFVDWTGTNGFRSVSNPLTVSNVTADMTITANFDVGSTMVPDGDMGYGGTTMDAYEAMLIASGSLPSTPGDLAHGDVAPLVNGRPSPDGKIDIGDVTVILRKALGLVTWQ